MPALAHHLSMKAATLLACSLSLTACSSGPDGQAPEGPRRRSAPQGPVVAIEPRVDHIVGTTLVMPVTVAPNLARSGLITALLEDGRDVGASLVWFALAADPTEDARWLPPAGRWTAFSDPGTADLSSPGFWAVVADLPLDAAGQGLWIDRGLLELNWIAIPPVRQDDPALRAVAPQAVGSPGYDALIEQELASPMRRWRGLLSTEGLRTPEPLPDLDGASLSLSVDPIEAISIQQQARWAAALIRLHGDDPDVCDRLKRAMCAHARLESGVWLPAWPLRQQSIDSLLADLLSPSSSARSRLRAAGYFIDEQTPALAWTIDDAGLVDARSGAALATIGVLNLGERATLAWAAPSRTESSPSLVPVQPGSGVMLTSTSSPINDRTGSIDVNLGRWNTRLVVTSEPIPVVPPGFRMGPFVPGWTLASLESGTDPSPRPSEVAWTTAALVERLPGASGRWTIYVECMRPATAGNDSDSVRIWLGPRERPFAVLRVTHDGSASNELAVQGAVTLVQPVLSGPDRWSFRIALPDGVLHRDSVLTIGMERIGPGGRRWSWPRAMTPWQVEPGRMRLTLDAWDSLPAR